MRAPEVRRTVASLLVLTAATAAAASPRFAERLVKLGGPPDDRAVRAHVAFAESAGFNGFFVYSGYAGHWDAARAPRGPFVTPEFAAFARAARARGLRVVVSVNPIADAGGTFVFSERHGERRIRRFLALLRREAGVDEFVVSFDDQPATLSELRDVARYGLCAAPAHLDLTRRLARRLGRGTRLWLCAAAYCDRHLGAGSSPYGRALLAGLATLPEDVGIVWTGPEVIPREIGAEALARTRARLGGRALFLYDNFPVNDDPGDALGLILAPLRGRDPALGSVASAYLACPMTELGASRLPLLTTAAWLADPDAYEPDRAWREAIATLAGPDPGARDALRTQALEWGGSPGDHNWRHRDEAYAAGAAKALDDPAAADAFAWTADRYPSRMAALERVADLELRRDLLRVMKRRLAVARALPLVAEYRSRMRVGRSDVDDLLAAIAREREAWRPDPDPARALDLFLRAAEVPLGAPAHPPG